jgi:hypothetical protein
MHTLRAGVVSCAVVVVAALHTSTSSTSSASVIPPHKQPLLEYVSTIAHDPSGNMRDPSPVVQDPVTGRWHFCKSKRRRMQLVRHALA